MYNETEMHSVDTNVLVLLLAYVAMEMKESNHNLFSVFFELVASSPTWYDIVCHFSIALLVATPTPVLMRKGNDHFLMHGSKVM